MNNTKHSEIFSKVIEGIYEQHPSIKSTIDSVLVNVCREENVSLEKVFFVFCFLS